MSTAHDMTKRYAFGCFIGIFVIISLILNTRTLYMFAKRQKWVTNIMRFYIISLTLSDLLQVPCLLLPTMVSVFQTGRWTVGSLTCKLFATFRLSFFNISVCTHAVIAIHRCRSAKGSQNETSGKPTIIILLIVWIYNLCSAIPYGFWYDVSAVRQTCGPQMIYFYEIMYYNYVSRTTNGLLPIVVTVTAYGIIVYRLKKVHSAPVNEITEHRNVSRSVTRVCIFIVSVYLICALPLQICAVVSISQSPSTSLQSAMRTTYCLYVFGSILNPIIYCITWKSFRKRFFEIIPRKCRCITESSDISESTYN